MCFNIITGLGKITFGISNSHHSRLRWIPGSKILDIHELSIFIYKSKRIKQLEIDLKEQGLVKDDELRAIEKEIDAEVKDSVEFALSAPEPDPNELTKYIWAE